MASLYEAVLVKGDNLSQETIKAKASSIVKRRVFYYLPFLKIVEILHSKRGFGYVAIVEIPAWNVMEAKT